MADLPNPMDSLRICYMIELTDDMTARAMALRWALIAGDISSADILFETIRLVGRDYVLTRKEIELADEDKAQEAA